MNDFQALLLRTLVPKGRRIETDQCNVPWEALGHTLTSLDDPEVTLEPIFTVCVLGSSVGQHGAVRRRPTIRDMVIAETLADYAQVINALM